MINYLKKEKVLCIALVLALVSSLLVFPDREYLGYVDVRVLALLFCLMLLVKGYQDMGLFDILIQKMLGGVKNSRTLSQLLVLLCFFLSMLITNDVALITFVPFAILALKLCRQEKLMIPVVVLQTIAANLGSMFTPIGNPQNLYLFSVSDLSLGAFFGTMLPLTALSLVLLLTATLLIPGDPIQVTMEESTKSLSTRDLIGYTVLFIINLLVVFRVISWIPALLITVAGVLLLGKKKLLRQVDYALLLTFVGFFIFVGNMGRIPAISDLVAKLLTGREILMSALLSQFLSNVPAALLLSGFTDNIKGLLIGTNVGGLGTIIASMASLISYKLYAAQPEADKGRYMLVFTLYNVAGLVILLAFSLIFY